jgi:hypothetical protein
MNHFFQSFSIYCKQAQFDSFAFWAFPIGTLLAIWGMTVLGPKIFTNRKKLKSVFIANRAWIVSSIIAATFLISLICYWWTDNYFAKNPVQLSLLISLSIAMLIPVLALIKLRNYYHQEGVKEIIDQPKTLNQLDAAIAYLKTAFRRSKLIILIPAIGFFFLLLYLYKGTNLISVVFDNSGSMVQTNAIDALSETFDNLQDNNEIILTTLDGLASSDDPAGKSNFKDLTLINKTSGLKAGKVSSFTNPQDAKMGLSQASETCYGSPICEAIWKTHLFIKESKANQSFKKKLLIIITDGIDNMDASIASGKFFFDDEGFAENFPPEDVFIIDFSGGVTSSFMQRSEIAGCDIYPADNNKEAYLNALDNALQSFKNNWFLIYWTALIFGLFTIICLLLQPKKII